VTDARARIAELRVEGHGPSEIARRLNADGIPTPSGLVGRWRSETVWRVEDPVRAAAYVREWRRDVKVNGPRRWQ
jgi:Recombinase